MTRQGAAVRTPVERDDDRFRLVFASSPIGMAVVGLDGHFIEVNEAACRITGWTQDELMLRDVESITHPDDLADDVLLADRLLAGEIPHYQLHKRYVRPDATSVWVLISVSLVRDPDGTPRHLLAQIVDIDRTVRAQGDLRRQEEQFRASFEASPTGMVISDRNGVWLMVNPAFAAMLGTTSDNLVGRHHSEFTHPDDVQISNDRSAATARGDTPSVQFEKRYVRSDGRLVWAHVAISALSGPDGEPQHLVQIHDITALREAADRLAERAQLLELARDAIIVRELDGRVGYWNPGAERVYGWTAESAVGRDLDDLLGTVWPSGQTRDSVHATVLRDGGWEGELEQLRSDGVQVVVLSRKALRRDADGRPIGILSINTDITDRREAEQALRASEQRFRSQFEHSAVGQCIRGVDDRLESVNPALARMLGYDDPSELVGVTASSIASPEAVRTRAPALAAVFAGETDAITYETQLVRRDGSLLDVHFTSSVVRDDLGRPMSFVSIFQDISERKAAEKERDAAARDLAERNAELEKMNQLKADLIGMLGHQINNPLAVILGCTELARDDDLGAHPDEWRTYVETIDRNAHRLDRTVREVLALVALDAGRLVAHPEPVRLRDHLAAAMESTAADAALHCPADLLVSVQPGHLEHMVVNLLTNAAKYGDGAIEVRAVARDEEVDITVVDSGPGVDRDFSEHLFERFARQPGPATRVTGTGLGLFIVRQLAAANHGRVGYVHDDAGTRFTVTLPRVTTAVR